MGGAAGGMASFSLPRTPAPTPIQWRRKADNRALPAFSPSVPTGDTRPHPRGSAVRQLVISGSREGAVGQGRAWPGSRGG